MGNWDAGVERGSCDDEGIGMMMLSAGVVMMLGIKTQVVRQPK